MLMRRKPTESRIPKKGEPVNDEVKTRFETSGELTSDFVRKTCTEFMAKNRMSKRHRIMIVCIWVLLVLDALLTILNGNDWLWPFIGLGFAYVLFDLLMEWAVRRTIKTTVQRFEEEYHAGVVSYTTAFSDTQAHLKNHTSGSETSIDLSAMKRLMKVDDTWVIITQTSAFIPVFVSELSETDQKSVLDLLKQNNPKIKILLPKK